MKRLLFDQNFTYIISLKPQTSSAQYLLSLFVLKRELRLRDSSNSLKVIWLLNYNKGTEYLSVSFKAYTLNHHARLSR